MMLVMGWLAGGDLLVVETDDDWYLGSVEVTAGSAIVRSGFVGRPTVVPLEDVVRIVPVAEYERDDEG